VLWGAAEMADLDLHAAAAENAVLQVVFVSLAVGALILIPSMTWLFILFQRGSADQPR
jgi:cytochrome d ubiquinol oxidase subunit II